MGSAAQNLGTMLVNASKTFPAFFNFLTGLSVIVGLMCVVFSLYKLKHLSDMRMMGGGQQELGKIFGLMIIGIIFLWMPYVLNAVTYSFFGMGIKALQNSYALAVPQTEYWRAFLQLMQLVGLISFVRGWFILASMAKGQQQQGTLTKAVTHLVAGALLFNLSGTVNFLENTLGVKFLF